MTKEMKHVLTESSTFVKVPMLTSSNIRKYSVEEQNMLAIKFIQRSVQFNNKLAGSNKNIKEIDKTQGQYRKYKAVVNIDTSIKNLRRLSNVGNVSTDLKLALSTVEQAVALLHKHERQFVRAYKDQDDVTISVYRAIVSALGTAVLTLNTSYAVIDKENVRLTVYDGDLSVMNKTSFKALSEFIKFDKDGTLFKVFTFRQEVANLLANKEALTESVEEIEDTDVPKEIDYNAILKSMEGIVEIESAKDQEEVLNEAYVFSTLDHLSNFLDLIPFIRNHKQALLKLVAIIAIVYTVIAITRYVLSNYYQWRVNVAEMLEESAEILYQETATINDASRREVVARRADQLAKLAQRIDLEGVDNDRQTLSSMEKLDRGIESEFNQLADVTFNF